MVEKRLLTVFIMTCALGLAVVLHLFQLNVHNVIPCLCSLPTEPSPEGLQLGDYVCAGGTDILKFDKKHWFIVFHISHWGDWSFVCRAKPTKALHGDGTGYQQISISKTVLGLPNHASRDIGLLNAQQWLQCLTFDGYCDEYLCSVQPLPSCTTIAINALFNKSVNHNHI